MEIKAGVETSMTTLLWMILLMIRNPNMQRKLRDEIHEKLNGNVPVISDKVNLDYVMAYISETLRYKNVAPIGVFHRAISSTKIGMILKCASLN